MSLRPQTRRIRFGPFLVDLASRELFNEGIRIRLQDQPFQILEMLLEQAGVVVPRDEMRRRLWADDTFVDFDAGMNAAIRRLRDALNDSADEPRYIQTLHRHGYRFIAKVDPLDVSDVDDERAADPLLDSPPTAIFPSSQVLTASASPSGRPVVVWSQIAGVVVALFGLVLLSAGAWRRGFHAHASTRIQSIAVLPLQNLSDDPAQEYFADGMTDALITDLAHIASLRVTSRTSAMRYKNSRESISKIARDLGVDAVVEGSVVRSGNRVRINAQLIEGSTDRHIWANSFEGDLSDVLVLQDKAAASISKEIAENLHQQEPMRSNNVRAVNPAAYEAYLKGDYFSAKLSDDGFERAKDYYEKSITFDPSYAPAYVGLGEVFSWLAFTNRQPPADSWIRAESYLSKAVSIDPQSPKAHVLLGMIRLFFDCDRDGAEKELKYALQLDPGNSSALDYYSYYLLETGQVSEAIEEKKRVVARDPVSVRATSELGLYFLRAGRNDEAVEQLKNALELDPNFAPAHIRLGLVDFNKGQTDQAIAEIKAGIALESTPTRIGTLADVYFRAGRLQELPALIQELEDLSNRRYVSPSLIAAMYARIGDSSQALTWLAKAKPGDEPYVDDPAFDTLRLNPRFKRLEPRLTARESCSAL